MGSSSSTAEAGIDETTAAMTSTPRAESVLRRYSGLGRGDVSPRSVAPVARSFLLPWAVLGFPRVLSCYFGCSWFNTLLELIRPLLPAGTWRSKEIAGSSSRAEAASDEAAAAMMNMPGADSALLRYSGLGRGAW